MLYHFTYLLLCMMALFPVGLIAQDTMETLPNELIITGKYTGDNLYVLNPSVGDAFSVQQVTVNGKDYPFTTNSNAFEISLNNFEPNDYVVVQIVYTDKIKPEVINTEVLVEESEFALPSFVYNKRCKLLTWDVTELSPRYSYQLEQMLYGKWISIKALGTPEEMISNNYLPVLITGINLFRIKQIDENGKELFSPIVKLKSPNLKILLLSDKVKEYIEFSGVTHYVLYDANGFFLRRGTAKKVNVQDLKKGNYWINFDGKETMITKK